MNLEKNLILVKGEDKTAQIEKWEYDNGKIIITFNKGKTYSYNQNNVVFDKEPVPLDINNLIILNQEKPLYQVVKALRFLNHTRIYFKSGNMKTFSNKDLTFIKSVLTEKRSNDILRYFKEIAYKISLETVDGQSILGNKYDRIKFVREDSALSSYLTRKISEKIKKSNVGIVYPFGINISQKQAVENALSNQISVIEGPPGTGKTQTILNIIANAVMHGNSVAVVSSNNEATKNVLEKLSKNDVSFIAAYLGSGENKQQFIASQNQCLPDLSDWYMTSEEYREKYDNLVQMGQELDNRLEQKNKLSALKQEYEVLVTEQKHFLEYYATMNPEYLDVNFYKKLKPQDVLQFWIELENKKPESKDSFLCKILYAIKFGLFDKKFYAAHMSIRISICQKLFYDFRLRELGIEIKNLENGLEQYNFTKIMDEYTKLSMKLFKSKLHSKYVNYTSCKQYNMDDLWKNSESFIKDYPVILSTTYSLRGSLSSHFVYDYVIVDEASQVNLATGVLALSCAKNAVIVGDLKQLPNVITDEEKKKVEEIFERYHLPDAYCYSKHSLLSSVNNVYSSVPRTMLKEHYRCHPKIIGFCNQKFYNNQLIILTKPSIDKEPLIAYKTVKGNHSRDRMNLRQIDVIEKEVLPQQNLNVFQDSIGIVTPYRNQTEQLQKVFAETNVKVDTVDKFQGQERDIIILSTVDDEITEFSDDPNRLNVAVSRAINQLIVVTDGNKAKRNTNIGDLIGYIQYNNFEIIESKIYSIFDYLYKYYEEQRKEFLRKTKKISEYDSENLMYVLIMQILKDSFNQLDVAVHVPLRMIIKEINELTQSEIRYVLNNNTHVDFLIYYKITHQPVLIVEVDGYEYHKKNTIQAERDVIKNAVLDKYNLPYIRFATNGSEEKEQLIQKLKMVI